MKGDIGFVGFMLTADEWHELDAQSRAQLIAVATRRTDPAAAETPPRRFPEGTGKHEIVESIDDELIELDLADAELVEPFDLTEAALEAEIERVDRDGDIALFADDAIVLDTTAEADVIEEWLALRPSHDHIDHDEWIELPPAQHVSAASQPLAIGAVTAADVIESRNLPPSLQPGAGEPFEDFADWAEL